MDQSFDKLRRKVLQAVDEQRSSSQAAPRGHQQVMGEFIRLQLTKLGMSEDKFAHSLSIPAEQVRLLLQGQLPDNTLTDDLLQHIAQVSNCEPNLLYIMLNRPVSPTIATDNPSDTATHSV